jgi:hypothetical protein
MMVPHTQIANKNDLIEAEDRDEVAIGAASAASAGVNLIIEFGGTALNED